jgi:putative methyltransferase (TIGR04325 family)
MNAKQAARAVTPPLLWELARRLKSGQPKPEAARPTVFTGPLASWADALRQSDGWDAPAITRKTLEVSRQVRDGTIAFQQDTIAHESVRYSATVLAFLLLATSGRTGRCEIIDFGGSLGTHYYQNRKILAQITGSTVGWNIVERPDIAALGREHFREPGLTFFASLAEAKAALSAPPAAFLFSGSLQCLEEPFRALDDAVALGARVLAFDRLLVSPGERHEIYLQRPNPQRYYRATYPAWCFAKGPFIAAVEARGFTRVDQFTDAPRRPFDHCGLLFVRAGSRP